ncbi:MAG: transporter substrate-binding domain-containing protein [Magnetococcales bacterium]|nr:transporter substrate-binding domain-containing protein [Magnetococcales bacterium]
MSPSRLIWLLLAAVVLFFPIPADAGRVVRVGVYQNSPGVFTTEDGKTKGFYIDILKETATRENWHLDYVAGTWSEGLARLESGEIDLLVAIAHTSERAKKFSFTQETVFSNWGQVYVRSPSIQSILDLEGRKIAGLKGDIYTIRLDELLDSFHIAHQMVETAEYRDVLRLIAAGEVDAGVVARSNATEIEKNYNVFRSPIVCCPMEIRYATLSGKNQDLLDTMDRHIAQLKADKQSLYYHYMDEWYGNESKRELPVWLTWALAIVTSLAILLTVGVVMLRRQRHHIEEKLEASYTEKREMELKMLATSKLASIGEVATGVAHELNQPLTYISTFTQNLELSLQNNSVDLERIKKRVVTVNEQFRRIDEIIRHMQTFGHQGKTIGESNKQAIHLAEVVEKTLLFLGERIRLRNISLEKHFDPNTPPILGNMTRLEQIFINFFQNAIHALTDRADATITITIAYLPASQKVQVQFSDNGTGMEPAVRKKIFEPFFTTKAIGEGTGLGLSIVYGIVQEHNGTITCISEPGLGTTFALLFPEKKE